MSRSQRTLLLLLVLAVASRVATTIYYLEDPDSLRFALGVRDFDLGRLQPHFPGYPVFLAVVKPLYLLLGSYAVAFSIVGGLAAFLILFYLLRLLRLAPDSPAGGALALLVLLNPLFWLMGNRYMPDLLGVAGMLAAWVHLVLARDDEERLFGFFLAGILAGLRLSYLPFLLPPVLVLLARDDRARRFAAGTAGVLAWLIPMLLLTGWETLLDAARNQTEGHFHDFGGTVVTEPEWGARWAGLLQGLWADGLGTFWPGRSGVTIVVAVGVGITLAAGVRSQLLRRLPHRAWALAGASWLTYFTWILLYQNVIYKSRHVLPLLPMLLAIVAAGVVYLGRGGAAGRVLSGAFLVAYSAVAVVLVGQHRRPTAIAQVAEAVREEAPGEAYIVSTPLVVDYLQAAGIRGRFVAVETTADQAAVRAIPGSAPIFMVGDFSALLPRAPEDARTFYHNPYVNRMWPEVTLRRYR